MADSNRQKAKFLTARWEYLAMANYEVNPEILLPFLPKGTEIDFVHGKTYLSLVGFMFLNTRVLGIPVPFHTNFEEVNLRFYVRYFEPSLSEWRRGVVFVKEIVPKFAIANIARLVYNENYITLGMDHEIKEQNGQQEVLYRWKFNRKWNYFKILAEPGLLPIPEGSNEEFITEHYWGYTRLSADKSLQYQVEHPRWEVFKVKDYQIDCDFSNLYGAVFTPYLQSPSSVLLARGSEISVRFGEKMN